MIYNFINILSIFFIETLRIIVFCRQICSGVTENMLWRYMKKVNFRLGVGWVGAYLQKS